MMGTPLVIEVRRKVWGLLVVINDFKTLSWNVRGLNNPRKRKVSKNLLKEWRCDIVCL